MKRMQLLAVTGAAGTLLLFGIAWKGGAQNGGPQPARLTTVLGQSLPGLTDAEKSAFEDGLKSFSKTEIRSDGLGPVFNGTSCAECHKAGAIGGA